MNWQPRDAESYTHALMAYLPLGEVWPRDIGSELYKICRGLMGVVARWGKRTGLFLITEAFPPHSYLLLPDWERVLGLPEPCYPPAQTLAERRLQVLEKLRRRPGGQSRQYFIDIARRLGYYEDPPSPYQLPMQLPAQVGKLNQITITEYRPFMAGVSRAGDDRWGIAPHHMRFVWKIGVPGQRLNWFRAGQSRASENPHVKIRHAEDLECVLQKLKPAHSRLIFSYTGG